MKYCMITFRSVTPAQGSEGLLRRAGIGCTLHRTPRWMEQQGCGYSLRLKQEDVMGAVRLLRANDMPFRKVYCKGEDGKLEELFL